MNKLFSVLRNSYKMTVIDLITIVENNLHIGQSRAEKIVTRNSNVMEGFLLINIFDVLAEEKDYLIAKNSLGDVLIEISDTQQIVSIRNDDGEGKFSIFSPSNPLTQEDGMRTVLKAFIAYKFACNDSLLAHMNATSFTNEEFVDFVTDVRNTLFNYKTNCFLSVGGYVHPLDMGLGLPCTKGMSTSPSLVHYGEVNYRKVIKLPEPSEFKSVICGADEELLEQRIFDEIESFNLTPEREYSIDEEVLIAENEERTEKYVLSPVAKAFLTDYFDLATVGVAPLSCAFYGPSGSGKTVSAQTIARELHRPYVHFKVTENTDEDSLRGVIKSIQGKNGEIEYEDSAIVKALKNGYVCEVQELSVCNNPGAETFFNPILDKTRSFTDSSGKTFSVHPDALIVFTYNPDYAENNQIATSLLNRIEDNYRVEFPDKDTVVKMLISETGFANQSTLETIYDLCFGDGSKIGSIKELLSNEDAEEELSLRQVINWINRYMNCRRYNGKDNGWVNAAVPTIVMSLGVRDKSLQQKIMDAISAVF